MRIKKFRLLGVAAFVWIMAGFNILRIGVESYKNNITILGLAISALVFYMFWSKVFSKLVKKHTFRISNMVEDRQFIMKFFDKKSFFMMASMMILGIGLRSSHILDVKYIAVFYTGLGAALLIAGLYFGLNYMRSSNCPIARKLGYIKM